MSSEGASDRTLNDRMIELLNRINGAYHTAEGKVRTVSPYFVRTVELLLAVGLLAALLHWLNWVYIVGV